MKAAIILLQCHLLCTARSLAEFVALLALAFAVTVAAALPWALRTAVMLAWVSGLYVAYRDVGALYVMLGDAPAALPAVAIVWPLAVLPALALKRTLHLPSGRTQPLVWGAFAFGGAVAWGLAQAARWASVRPGVLQLASVLPALVASMLLVYLSVKFKQRLNYV